MRLDAMRLPTDAVSLARQLVREAGGDDGVLTASELAAYVAAHPHAARRSRAVMDVLSAHFQASPVDNVTYMVTPRVEHPALTRPRHATPTSLTFAPVEGTRVRLNAVGDLLLHGILQQAADRMGDFSPLLSNVASRLADADVTMANLETSLAGDTGLGGVDAPTTRLYDGETYSGYPAFNAHPRFADAIVGAGIDLVTTANNHALDRAATGIDRTLATLDARHIQHVGSHPTTDLHGDRYVIRDVNGVRMAFVAYTFSTNGIPDRRGQVQYTDRDQMLADVATMRARPDVDVVVVAPHWGTEYTPRQPAANERLARELVDAGADLVIGAHPHVLQPIERHTAPDGHEGIIAYSLGNFIAAQARPQTQESAILHIELTRPTDGSRVRVTGVSYDAVEIQNRFLPELDGSVPVPVLVSPDSRAGRNVAISLGVPGADTPGS